MSHRSRVSFEIIRMDALGQGVSKLTDKVTFIPKTVVGDKGEAEIMSEKKGVTFARLKKLTEASSKRTDSPCVHFGQCPSCHFLHVSYEDELEFKTETFKNLFRKLPLQEIQTISAPSRLNYRNRVQLHYSLKSKLLGMRDPMTFEITEIPKCLIAVKEIQTEIQRLYENKRWLSEAPSAPMEGHVELYWHNQTLKVSWNEAYSAGGFTQVFETMNLKLKELLKSEWKSAENSTILDLFGGNGNLSSTFNYSRRLCVDSYSSSQGEEFLNQNLYDKNALRNVVKEMSKRNLKASHLLLDPPRSGMKDLSLWLNEIRPECVAYVSCDPHTLVRDLQNVKNYRLGKGFLMDFFPSTFHFESLVFLERNS